MADRLRYVIINDSIEKLYYQNVLLEHLIIMCLAW